MIFLTYTTCLEPGIIPSVSDIELETLKETTSNTSISSRFASSDIRRAQRHIANDETLPLIVFFYIKLEFIIIIKCY